MAGAAASAAEKAVFGSGVFLLACTLLQFIMPGQAALGSYVAAMLWDFVDKLFSTIMSLGSVLVPCVLLCGLCAALFYDGLPSVSPEEGHQNDGQQRAQGHGDYDRDSRSNTGRRHHAQGSGQGWQRQGQQGPGWQHNEPPPTQPMSKKDKKKAAREARRRARQASGEQPYGFVDVVDGKRTYFVSVQGWQTAYSFTGGFTMSEAEWNDLVDTAERSTLYRRTNDVLHFVKELEAAIKKKLTKQSQPQGRQQQQQQRQQPGSQPRGGQAAQHNQLRGQYAAAAAAAPDLDSMSVAELRSFVRQYGSSSSSHVSSCNDKQDLQQLAQRSLQVYECRRLIRCGQLPDNTTQQLLLAAQCTLRVYTNQAPHEAAAAARALALPDLRRRYQRLALAVHPDKVWPEHQGMMASFEEAFKVLGQAHQLLSDYCTNTA